MILPAFLALFGFLAQTSAYRFVCYYGSWSVYRQGPGKFLVEDIDPNVCTHLVYTFGGIDHTGKVIALDAWNDIGDEWHEGAFTKLQRLRKINPRLKIMFAVGGWNEGSEKYSRVMSNEALRRNFVQSALNFTRTHKFDGFDLDWEYPAFRGGKPEDKQTFSLVIKELAEVFRPHGLLLSAAVTANALNIDISYDCVTISDYLNFINIMTYDLHWGGEPVTGHHTALYKHPLDPPGQAHLNVKSAVEAWINCGANPSKLNLGVASYGRTFTLADPKKNGIGAPATGPGPAGQFVPEGGFLGYNEICFGQKQKLWTVSYEPTQQVPYAFKKNIWVGYDDPASIVKKVAMAKQYKLGGMMIWSIETDDFSGNCGLGKNPLLYAVKNELVRNCQNCENAENEVDPFEPLEPSEPSEPFEPIEPIEPDDKPEVIPEPTEGPHDDEVNYDYKCKTLGQLFRHPEDCNAFFMCTYKSAGNDLRAVQMRCGQGLVFDQSIEACTFQSDDCPAF